jgi:hypothetical protein
VHRAPFLGSSLGLFLLAAALTAGAPSCGNGTTSSRPTGVNGSGAGGSDDSGSAGTSLFGSSGTFFIDASLGGEGGVGNFQITPANPVIDVTVVDGVITQISGPDGGSAMITFTASANGQGVSPMWSIDKGELGTIDAASGAFSTTGKFGGAAKISATLGDVIVTTTLSIRLHITQNGRGVSDGGAVGVGGAGGVGGEGLGGKVDDATMMRLKNGGTPPASAQELSWLYPYDKTVWPRGILAPLLQWTTSHTATSVYIHLKQDNYEFEGYYSGNALVHQPIDQFAWSTALTGNGGDALHVEVKIADANNVYGPISEDWIIAAGVLKGTVYYNSYNTRLAKTIPNGKSPAAVLAIRPGANDPTLALPGTETHCVVCHTVSDDGSTLFAQTAIEPNVDQYPDGASYNLTNNGAVIQKYTNNAPDGTTNNRKFLWAGLWKDGTFGLQSGGGFAYTQEGYGGDSRIFRRDNANAVTAAGFDGQIKQAVTPAFSRDGKMVAFSYADGTMAPGAGHGHTLDLMDFDCGAPAAPMSGAPSCTAFAFSNLRRIYTNMDNQNGYVGWPAWLPDSTGIVFHNTVRRSDWSPISTWQNAKAQIWFIDVPAGGTGGQAIPLSALNGIDAAGNSTLPKIANHDDDFKMNYEPTVNPIPSGGYNWVVFTSRRAYGNIASGDAYATGDGTAPIPKKLWVAAIDLHPTPGKDPSHPAFYLPGQEVNAGNMRGFWSVDPCHPDGASCQTGDECCNGYCRPDMTGKLVCGGKPPGCAQEFEKCTMTSDCCGASFGYECINGFCTQPQPAVK